MRTRSQLRFCQWPDSQRRRNTMPVLRLQRAAWPRPRSKSLQGTARPRRSMKLDEQGLARRRFRHAMRGA